MIRSFRDKEFMLRPEATATACMGWGERWKTETGRREWLKPEFEVREIAELLRSIGISAAMDPGCGIG